MIGEIGEVIDIVKKHGGENAAANEDVRVQLVEELADVLMYYNDVLLCYGIGAEELKRAYTEKHRIKKAPRTIRLNCPGRFAAG